MSYYRAELEDFYIGRVYEQQFGGANNWRVSMIDEEHMKPQPGGHFHFMEVVVNLQQFKNRLPYYKIKHLDADDIVMLGFHKVENKSFEDPNDYEAFAFGIYTLVFYKETSRVDIFETVNGKEERVFTGQLLDFNELTLLLKQVGIIVDLKRKEKVKERV